MSTLNFRNKQIKELTLLLMYLQSWEETAAPVIRGSRAPKPNEESVRRCWQGYDYEVLKELEGQGYIVRSGTKAPHTILPEGERFAEQLLKKYPIIGGEDRNE